MIRCLMIVRFKNYGIDLNRYWEVESFEMFFLRNVLIFIDSVIEVIICDKVYDFFKMV